MREALIRATCALACALAAHAALITGAAYLGWFSSDNATLPELDMSHQPSSPPCRHRQPSSSHPRQTLNHHRRHHQPSNSHRPLSNRRLHLSQNRNQNRTLIKKTRIPQFPKKPHHPNHSNLHLPQSRPRPHLPRRVSTWTKNPRPAAASSPNIPKARASAARRASSNLNWTYRQTARWTACGSSPPAVSRNSTRPPFKPPSAPASSPPDAVPFMCLTRSASPSDFD